MSSTLATIRLAPTTAAGRNSPSPSPSRPATGCQPANAAFPAPLPFAGAGALTCESATWTTGSSIPRGLGDRERLQGALDLEALEIGGLVLERLLDRELERRRRGGAAAAAALEPDARHAVLEPEQLDVPAVRLHVRAHPVERARHPRLEGDRVEPVDQEQAGDDAVLGEPLADGGARLAGVVDDREDPLEPVPVDAEDGGEQVVGDPAGDRVVDPLELGDQLLEPGRRMVPGPALRPRIGGRHAPVALPATTCRSGCASPCAPCPSPRTCAPHKAGTGRSCGPRA